MGPTTVPVASGAVSPTSPLAYTSDAPTVTLNGETVSNVPFSGLTPTVVGLYQIDFQVPADAAERRSDTGGQSAGVQRHSGHIARA